MASGGGSRCRQWPRSTLTRRNRSGPRGRKLFQNPRITGVQGAVSPAQRWAAEQRGGEIPRAGPRRPRAHNSSPGKVQ